MAAHVHQLAHQYFPIILEHIENEVIHIPGPGNYI